MSNLEHLIENGLCRLEEGKSYREWREVMQEDCNWEGNENITIDNLWEICQYVIYTWDLEKSLKEREPKHGHWIDLQNCSNAGVYCSECRVKVFPCYPMKKKLSLFCPHCGAKMDGETVKY